MAAKTNPPASVDHRLPGVPTLIAGLSFDPANVRKHGERNVDAIKASLRRFGQVKPIVVDEDGIVRAGNGTLRAATELGWVEIGVERTHLKGSEATAYAIADNRTAELAEWEGQALAEQLRALQSEDFDLDAVGYTADEVDAMIEGLAAGIAGPLGDAEEAPEAELDRASELQEKWETAAGQVWVIPSLAAPGKEHRLICGDSVKAEDVARLMRGDVSDCIWTDPPYGVAYVGKTKDALTIENDRLDENGLNSLLGASLGLSLDHCRPGAAIYVAAPPGPLLDVFAQVLRKLGVRRHTLIWVKDQFVLGHSDFHYRHETLFYGWKEGKRHEPPTRDQDSVWEIARPRRSEEHPTMKPVELIAKALRNSTDPGDLVYEPFSGSGTTIVAAEQNGRLCRAVEIAPKYVAVTLERLAAIGLNPYLDSGG